MNDLIDILSAANVRDYIGEPISQLEHALQAAYFAKRAKASEPEIIAALLHDIGHLVGQEPLHPDVDLGICDHEIVGADYLKTIGAPEIVCDLVKSHVQAKRYLVYKSLSYRSKLSPASVSTLLHQGGPMSHSEATAFEADPIFRLKVALRGFDERAKIVGLEVPSLATYIPMISRSFGWPTKLMGPTNPAAVI